MIAGAVPREELPVPVVHEFTAGRFVVRLLEDESGTATDEHGRAHALTWAVVQTEEFSAILLECDTLELDDRVRVAEAAMRATGADTRPVYDGEAMRR